MKNALFGFFAVIFLVVLAATAYLPQLALAFAASMTLAAILGWGFEISAALAYFAVAWKVYAALGVFTFAFVLTYSHMHCCFGRRSFATHLKHGSWMDIGEYLLAAIVWPWCWYVMDKNLEDVDSSLCEEVLDVVEYWWQGTSSRIEERA